MSWVFVARNNDGIEEKDLSIPATRFYSSLLGWGANNINCQKWESAEAALTYMQFIKGASERKTLFDWMIKEAVQLEQLL